MTTESNTVYCLHCEKYVKVQDIESVVMKNGHRAMKGTCPNCSEKVFWIR